MRWRLTVLTIPLALVALGFGSRSSFSAPPVQSDLGQGAASFQRVDLRRTLNPLKHCFKRKGVRSCQGVNAPADNASAGTAAAPGTLSLPKTPSPGANFGPTYGNRRIQPKSAESQADGSPPGLKFTGGMGVPTNRATLEGALSPYQQPNGNTAASKLSNGIEAQGMHFGLEWHY